MTQEEQKKPTHYEVEEVSFGSPTEQNGMGLDIGQSTVNNAPIPHATNEATEPKLVLPAIIKSDLHVGHDASSNAIEINLDQINPIEAAKEMHTKLAALELRAKLTVYLSSKTFEDIRYDDVLPDTTIENKREVVDSIIEDLEKNTALNKDEDFLKKLYKLKDISDLISEALDKKDLQASVVGYEKNVREAVSEYMKKLDAFIQGKQKSSHTVENPPSEDGDIKLLKKECSSLEMELKRVNNTIISLAKNIADRLEKNIEGEAISFIESEIQALFSEIFRLQEELDALSKQPINNPNIDTTSFDELLLEKSNLVDENNRLIQDAVEKDKEIEGLKTQNLELEGKIRVLQQSFVGGNMAEDNEEETLESLTKNQPKKSILKKIVIGATLFIVVIVSIFSAVAYTTKDETPPIKPNYTQPQKPLPTSPKVNETATPMQVPPQVQEFEQEQQKKPPLVQVPVAAYDYNKILTLDEFSKNKFVIKGKTSVEVNGKKFEVNDVVNGFKFVKATSEGKLLFISPESTPEWVSTGGNN